MNRLFRTTLLVSLVLGLSAPAQAQSFSVGGFRVGTNGNVSTNIGGVNVGTNVFSGGLNVGGSSLGSIGSRVVGGLGNSFGIGGLSTRPYQALTGPVQNSFISSLASNALANRGTFGLNNNQVTFGSNGSFTGNLGGLNVSGNVFSGNIGGYMNGVSVGGNINSGIFSGSARGVTFGTGGMGGAAASRIGPGITSAEPSLPGAQGTPWRTSDQTAGTYYAQHDNSAFFVPRPQSVNNSTGTSSTACVQQMLSTQMETGLLAPQSVGDRDFRGPYSLGFGRAEGTTMWGDRWANGSWWALPDTGTPSVDADITTGYD